MPIIASKIRQLLLVTLCGLLFVAVPKSTGAVTVRFIGSKMTITDNFSCQNRHYCSRYFYRQ